jgi:hypothetical protein
VAQWIKRSACNLKVVGPGHPQKESLVVSGRASDQKSQSITPVKEGAPSLAFSSEGVCDVVNSVSQVKAQHRAAYGSAGPVRAAAAGK